MTISRIRMVVCAVILLTASSLNAQIGIDVDPQSWTNDKINWQVPVENLPHIDVDALMAEDEINNQFKDIPYRFGETIVMGDNLGNSGRWHELPSGDRIWMMKYHSDGAFSLNLVFDLFEIPEGGILHIYSEDKAFKLGGYTSEHNNEAQEFGTFPIPGEDIIIEYFEPAEQQGNTLLQIATVTHAYRDIEKIARDIGDSGTCNNNVVCPEGDPWQNEIDAVAIIVVGGGGICTGSLINNSANDGHPYFLTANHCVGGSVATWSFRFNFESTTCATNNSGAFQTVGGGTLLASGGSADYALLEINNGNIIPESYDPYMAGWDATGVNPSSQVCVHHPSGDLKKITFDNNPAGTGNFGGATCWRIFNWEDGTTEPGSSGSPLFDQNHRIIGQLFGGTASCGNNIDDYYGKFDVTYPNVCQWLDPACNGGVLDGIDPYAPSVALDAQLQNVLSPQNNQCGDEVAGEVVVRNSGTTTLTSFTINYNIDGGANNTFNWTGTLASASNVTISLPALTSTTGAHTFNATVSNPNGGVDENPGNDSNFSSFSIENGEQSVFFSITMDNYAEETSWELTTDLGVVVYSFGPYTAGSDDQTTFDYTFCLDAGCYQLNVFDSFGDGMQFNGVEGDYLLTDQDGNVLAEIVPGANFGAEANHPFCLTATDVPGCTDSSACNYDASATVDDGSCILPDGCTDMTACNYDASATCDDGSCILPDGCTDMTACNYDASAQCDNGSCEYASNIYYLDSDSDGYGDMSNSIVDCSATAPMGYSDLNTDCDDSNDSVYPGAPGTAEGIDNNCNDVIDPSEELPCEGDYNNDGTVDVQDLLIMLQQYGCTGACLGDTNGDGIVNQSDFLSFLSVFGSDCE